MAEFTSILDPIDEDGYREIAILRDGEVIDTQYLRSDLAWQWVAQELGILRSIEENPGECEHGLSAGLCAGPQHYPAGM